MSAIRTIFRAIAIGAARASTAREHAPRNAQVGFPGALQPVCVSHEAGSPEPIGLIPGRLALSAISNACRQGMQNVYGLNVDEEHLEPVLRPRLPRSSCRQRTSDPCAARLSRPTVRGLPEIMHGSQVLLRAPSPQNGRCVIRGNAPLSLITSPYSGMFRRARLWTPAQRVSTRARVLPLPVANDPGPASVALFTSNWLMRG
jgi:hypothetical protein